MFIAVLHVCLCPVGSLGTWRGCSDPLLCRESTKQMTFTRNILHIFWRRRGADLISMSPFNHNHMYVEPPDPTKRKAQRPATTKAAGDKETLWPSSHCTNIQKHICWPVLHLCENGRGKHRRYSHARPSNDAKCSPYVLPRPWWVSPGCYTQPVEQDTSPSRKVKHLCTVGVRLSPCGISEVDVVCCPSEPSECRASRKRDHLPTQLYCRKQLPRNYFA